MERALSVTERCIVGTRPKAASFSFRNLPHRLWSKGTSCFGFSPIGSAWNREFRLWISEVCQTETVHTVNSRMGSLAHTHEDGSLRYDLRREDPILPRQTRSNANLFRPPCSERVGSTTLPRTTRTSFQPPHSSRVSAIKSMLTRTPLILGSSLDNPMNQLIYIAEVFRLTMSSHGRLRTTSTIRRSGPTASWTAAPR